MTTVHPYRISYSYSYGTGECDFNADRPITTPADVRAVAARIGATEQLCNVVITGFKATGASR